MSNNQDTLDLEVEETIDAGEVAEDTALQEGFSALAESFEGDVTIEDLRGLDGTEDYTDEQLLKLWKDAQSGEETTDEIVPTKPAVTPPAVTSRAWKFFKGDAEVSDIDKMTVADFLQGKISYTAMDKTQQKTLDELIRVAQYGHLNESKLSRALSERDSFNRELEKLSKAVDTHKGNEKTWTYALQQFAIGNEQPLAQLIDKFKQQLGRGPEQTPQPDQSGEYEAAARGQQIWYEQIVPRVDEVAKKYGAKEVEVRNATQQLIEREINLTPDRIQEIIELEIPYLLEQHGYRVGEVTAQSNGAVTATTPQVDTAKQIAALMKEIEGLKAGQQNGSTEVVRRRNKNLPPASGRSSGSDVEDGAVPAEAMKSPGAYKEWLRKG